MEYSKNWTDYKLLASGKSKKIEKFGDYILERPDPQAIWPLTEKIKVDAIYHRSQEGGGQWEKKRTVSDKWQMSYPSVAGLLTFNLCLMGFKHTGIFPEQAVNWDFMQRKIIEAKKKNQDRKIRVLNLFAYTGGATIACALAGADELVHVDASKRIIETAKENAKSSNCGEKYIRYIQDDVMKFILREQRRGSYYDAIIMDPPAYGRGPSGELWQLDQNVFSLIHEAVKLLNNKPLFLVLSAYANNLSPQALKNCLLKSDLQNKKGKFTADEIGLYEKDELILPCGYSVRFSGEED